MMDELYLNYSHAPLVSPLKKSLRIEIYNNTYFSPDTIKLDKPTKDQPITTIDRMTFMTYANSVALPSAQLFKKPGNKMTDGDLTTTPPTSSCSHIYIEDSKDKLFFIKLTPDQTMQLLWCLVQIDIPSTEEINPASKTNG